MPKRGSPHEGDLAQVRVEVVPRRGLTRQEAARYVGISTSKFDELIREGQMPEPFRIGSRTIWDLRKLDAAFDLLSGPENRADSFADWDAPVAKREQQSGTKKADSSIGVMNARRNARRGALARSIPSAEYPGHPNVYTPDTLAEYWQCSANHIRNLIRRGELAALRPSAKLLRISPAAVIAFEQANLVVLNR